MLKNLLSFILLTTIFIYCVVNGHGMQRTSEGELFEDFQVVALQHITSDLSNYLSKRHIKYTIYRIPNYVREFLKTNEDFSIVYQEDPLKYSIITFTGYKKPPKNITALKEFYTKLDTLANQHENFFNYLVHREVMNTHYKAKHDNMAYKDLRLRCNRFCIINPAKNTMFVFSHITDAEKNALDTLFREFEYSSD
ncbi:hypothetical protein IJ541_10695 [bacterium]|nr:hypothetical protein [bacterium]